MTDFQKGQTVTFAEYHTADRTSGYGDSKTFQRGDSAEVTTVRKNTITVKVDNPTYGPVGIEGGAMVDVRKRRSRDPVATREAILEAEVCNGGIGDLFVEGAGHAVEAEGFEAGGGRVSQHRVGSFQW